MATTIKLKEIPIVQLLNKDMKIVVEIDGEKRGEFRISKGYVDFFQKNAKTAHHKLTWEELIELILEHGTPKG